MSNTRRTTPRKPVRANSGEGRAIGLDDRDIPSGTPHLISAESASAKPVAPPRSDFPVQNAHGVEPTEGAVERPEAESKVSVPKPEPLPVQNYAVPVYNVEGPDHVRTRRDMAAAVITVNGQGKDPTRICSADGHRVEIQLLNEDAANDARFSESESAVVEGRGAILYHGVTGFTKMKTQGEIWAQAISTNPVKVSVIIITEVADS